MSIEQQQIELNQTVASIKSIQSVTDDGIVTYAYDSKRSVPKVLHTLYSLNPNISPEFCCIEGNHKLLTEDGPYFTDGEEAWFMTPPPLEILTPEVLASIIKKHFIGIGGIIGDQSVFFMKDEYNVNYDGDDYSHLVSHEIDPVALKKNYYQGNKTVGEFLAECYKKESLTTNDTHFTVSYECEQTTTRIARIVYNLEKDPVKKAFYHSEYLKLQAIECKRTEPCSVLSKEDMFVFNCGEYKDALISHKDVVENSEKLRSMLEDFNRCFEELTGPEYITEIKWGFQTMHGVPMDLQIAACAIVAGVTPEEMLKKLKACSAR